MYKIFRYTYSGIGCILVYNSLRLYVWKPNYTIVGTIKRFRVFGHFFFFLEKSASSDKVLANICQWLAGWLIVCRCIDKTIKRTLFNVHSVGCLSGLIMHIQPFRLYGFHLVLRFCHSIFGTTNYVLLFK